MSGVGGWADKKVSFSCSSSETLSFFTTALKDFSLKVQKRYHLQMRLRLHSLIFHVHFAHPSERSMLEGYRVGVLAAVRL